MEVEQLCDLKPNLLDIVRIPHHDGSKSHAVLLYGPNADGIVLLGVFEKEFESPEKVDWDFDSMLYTYDNAIRGGDWKVVGKLKAHLVEQSAQAVVRIIVNISEECRAEDSNSIPDDLPEPRIAGNEAARKYLHFLLKGGEERAFFRKNSLAMKAFLNK